MDRGRHYTYETNEERYLNQGFSRNEEFDRDQYGRQPDEWEKTNNEGFPECDYGEALDSENEGNQSVQNGYHGYRRTMDRDDRAVNRRYDDTGLNERSSPIGDYSRDHYRPPGHGLESRESSHWPGYAREHNEDFDHDINFQDRRSGDKYSRNDDAEFTDVNRRRDRGEGFDDINYAYQQQEQLQYQNDERGYDQSRQQHYMARTDSPIDHEGSNRNVFEMNQFRHVPEQFYEELDEYDNVKRGDYRHSFRNQDRRDFNDPKRDHREMTSDYYNQPGDTVDPSHDGRRTKIEQNSGGRINNAYCDVDDEEPMNIRTERLSRAIPQRRFGSRKRRRGQSRRERRQEMIDEGQVSFVDGMQTIIKRNKTMRQRRPLSELGAKSELGRMSVFIDSQFDFSVDEDDKLPSNRNVKRTKTLKQRLSTLQNDRTATVHDMAALLRDEVLTQEPSTLKGLNLMKYQWSMNWLLFKNWCKNMIYELEIWAGAFKVIEGHFGTSTVSYFRFLRWLMYLNVFMSVFMLGTILLPFLLLPPQGHGSFTSSVKNECASNFHWQAVIYSSNYTSQVEALVKNSSLGQKFRDVLQGTGWLENTVLFYGSYYNKTGFIPTDDPAPYNMALAYLCGVGVSFILSFVLLVKNSAKGLKQSAVSGSSGFVSMYCNKVFGAWDYCISQQNTADLKHKSILQEIMNELEYQRFQWKKESRTTKEKLKLYFIRISVNILVIAILSGALFLIYYTNLQLVGLVQKEDLNSVVVLIVQFLPSITLMLLSVVVPTIFNKLVVAEDYMPAFAIRITLIRTVLLRLASLGMLMISLYTSLQPSQNGASKGLTCYQSVIQNDTDTTFPCWETYVGQQIYKLVVLNFLVVIGSTFGWEFPRKLIFTKFHEKLKIVELLGQQTFDLSKSVLDLVYLQTLCWLGMFFSPILPIMCAITLFVFFYVKKGSLLTNCLPQQKYGTTKSNSLFMMVLLLSFFLAAIPIVFMIGKMSPSQGCGPFRIYSSEAYIMFDAVSNLVINFHEGKDVIYYIADDRVMVAIGFCLCLLMYYFWMVGQANYKLSKSLREQLKVEGQDKQFLVAQLALTQG